MIGVVTVAVDKGGVSTTSGLFNTSGFKTIFAMLYFTYM